MASSGPSAPRATYASRSPSTSAVCTFLVGCLSRFRRVSTAVNPASSAAPSAASCFALSSAAPYTLCTLSTGISSSIAIKIEAWPLRPPFLHEYLRWKCVSQKLNKGTPVRDVRRSPSSGSASGAFSLGRTGVLCPLHRPRQCMSSQRQHQRACWGRSYVLRTLTE